jgi:dUTP pyrophosphatase
MTTEEDRLIVVRRSVDAKLPFRASKGAAGYDLYSAETVTIPPKDRALIATDVAIVIPTGYYGQIKSRSSLAINKVDVKGSTVGEDYTKAGVVDSDYRGKIGVVLANEGIGEYEVKKGDRIAQLVIVKILIADVIELTEAEFDDFDGFVTRRGSGGFGSTGK